MAADPLPPPRLVLHAGFHKTGTTSLQAALAAHAPHLGPVAIQTRATSPALAAAAEAARRLSAGQIDGAGLAAALNLWAGGLSLNPGQGMIISTEDFAGHLPGARGLTTYSAAPTIAAALVAALRSRFGAPLDLMLLYTTREAGGWLRSVHWQLAKHPHMHLSSDRFARRFAAAADFSATLTRIRDAVPGIQVIEARLEEHGPRRLGPVEAAYDLIGLPQALRDTLQPVDVQNRGPAPGLADVLVALNRADLPDALRDEMKATLRRLAFKPG